MSMIRIRHRGIRRLPAFRPSRNTPELCAQLVGELICYCREQIGRAVEEIAPSAGLTPAEWEAIESGQPPESLDQVLMMTGALRLSDSSLGPLLSFSARAMEKR